MKYIKKSSPPAKFTDWLAKANDNWIPTYEDIYSDIREILKDSLIKEQGFICCYCEKRIQTNDSHIEHFKPQKTYKNLDLAYDNLLCSCQGEEDKKGPPKYCGHAKGDWFDPQLLISPLDPSCETRFTYEMDGEILPANKTDHAANETIKRLNLNNNTLKRLRKAAIDSFSEFSIIDIKKILNKKSNKFYQFHTAILNCYT